MTLPKGIDMVLKNALQETQDQADLDHLDIKQAASYFGCSTDTIRNLIAEGSLPAYRMGKRLIRIKKSDLEKLFHLIPSAAAK